LAEAEERRNLVNRLLELGGVHEPNGARGAQQRATPVPPPVPKGESGASRTNPASKTTDLEAAVETILTEAGTPLHISTIRERLIERGVAIPGRGDDANIIVRIRKPGTQFTRTARGTYALASWGLPSVDKARGRRRPKSKQ
jgi:hypothetical protein